MGDKEEKIEKVKGILASHGIAMNVIGCGCCGSPEVTFIYGGETIFDGEEDVNIRMVSIDDLVAQRATYYRDLDADRAICLHHLSRLRDRVSGLLFADLIAEEEARVLTIRRRKDHA